MRPRNNPGTLLCAATLILYVFTQAALGQQDASKSEQTDDVLRINTELVQTGVTVLDKQGRFVDGLKREDFELRVDGRPVSVSFFENIVSGSQRDRLARRAPGDPPAAATKGPTYAPSFRQRTIVFFLDDRHLSLDSVGRTRKMLLDFINKEMGQDDLVAIASASGQIGFLQQYTDNKEVLRAAVGRINHVPYVVSDYGRNPGTPMTEYMALSIERRDDSDVLDFFVGDCMKWGIKGADRQQRRNLRERCEVEVKNRARQILIQAGTVTSSTYYSLETLLRSAERLPGSKLAFFISDGFLADTGPRGPVATDKLERLTDEARRAGVVIYTIDARGLISGALDATGNVAFDPNGGLETSSLREIAMTQDALNALAADTGGRALRNQNSFDQFVNEALSETSRYYLLAWRPEASDEKNEKLKKIEVSVVGHPEWTVRSARGFVSKNAIASARDEHTSQGEKGAPKQQKPEADLRQALTDFYPRQALPLQLSLIYLDTPQSGIVLTSSVQAPTELLSYGPEDKEPAQLTLAGVVLNDQGKPAASFRTGLKVNPSASTDGSQNASTVIYNYPSPLKPGIYQVRVAARDDRSGVLGSAMQWIVIPDLTTRQLSLSSLIVGLESVIDKSPEAGRIQWSVDKKFAHGSHLRFMTFIYNASTQSATAATDLTARVQIYRDGQAIITTPFKKVSTEKQTDTARIPYTADINLGGLQAGRYTLQVTVEDRAAQKTVSQQTAFYVQ